ncbi:MAG: DUF1614 domain-containing protein [Candidatus Verstraetearchaeota archaeon]|nr:DUF1614 domain-containing protein [Candidatus Verstraetearchaeota archaeon]
MRRVGRIILRMPFHPFVLILLVFTGFFTFYWVALILGAVTTAFRILGLTATQGLMIATGMLFFSIILSAVDVVVYRVEKPFSELEMEFTTVFGIPYPVPRLRLTTKEMLVTVNVGGAIIPLAISASMIYLLSLKPDAAPTFAAMLLTTMVVTLVSYYFSRIVPGVGIVLPAFLPPMVSGLATVAFTGVLGVLKYALPVAYVGAVLGTLIGADLLNLAKYLDRLEAPLVSIGGAGTFDGIYLSGIIALVFTLFLT